MEGIPKLPLPPNVEKVLADFFGMSADAAAELVRLMEDPSCWLLGPAEGLWTIRIGRTPAGGKTSVLRGSAGAVVPHHRHNSPETVLVLQGSVHERAGRRALAMQMLVSDAGSAHELLIDSASGCVCAVRGG